MFGLFNRDFSNCPHYGTRDEDNRKVKRLELAHGKIIIRLDSMSAKDDELYKYLKKHMEDEGRHHDNTNLVLAELAEVMKTLVTDKEDRDKSRDKRDAIRDKILSSVAVVIILGLAKLLLDLYATNSLLGVS